MFQKEPEILGIFFSEDYKRFEKGTFIPLSSKYNGTFSEDRRELKISKNKNITEYNSIINKMFNLDIEIKGIIGNNGAGKSTILEIIKLFLESKIFISSNSDVFKLDKEYFGYKIDDIYSPGIHLITNYNLLDGKNRKYQNTIEIFKIKNSSYQEAKGNKGEDKLEVAIKDEKDSDFLINNILKEILGFHDNKIEKNIKIKTHGNSKSKKDSENILKIFESITNFLKGINNSEKNNFYYYVFNKIKSEKFNNDDKLFNLFIYSYWFFYFSWILRSNRESYAIYLNELFKKGIIQDLFYEVGEILNSNILQEEKIINNLINRQKNNYNILENYLLKKRNFFTRKVSSIDSYNRLMRSNDIDYKLSIQIFHYLEEHFNIEIYEGGDNGKYYMYFEFEYENFINGAIKNNFIKEDILNNYLVSLNIKLLDKNKNDFLMDSFSNGEKQMIKIFLQIKHLYEELKNNEEDNEKDIFILLDEPEEALHLEWQRKFLFYLLNGLNNIFKNYNGKLYIYFATHSPFIISDLSKENIIFLEREKIGDESIYNAHTSIKKFDDIKRDSNIYLNNTFLGNIPELIKGGFFLESQYGYLGEKLIEKLIENNNIKTLLDIKDFVGDKFIFEYLMLKNLNK